MLWFFISLAAFIAVYVVWLRPLMRVTSWGKTFLDWIEPIERMLWWKSESILWARTKMVSGLLLTALTQAGTIDITPLMPFVPDKYESIVKAVWNMLPLTITIIGWIDERLRKETTRPLEVVAMRTDAAPEAKAAAEAAEVAAARAVVVAKETGAV